MSRPSWEAYALGLAWSASIRSEDPHVKVGAVVLRPDNSVAGVGYNGTASGVEIDWQDRDGRRPFVIHAETNALRFCTPLEVRGGLMAVTHVPCPACMVNAAAYGLDRVVFDDYLINYDTDEARRIATTCGIALSQIGEHHE